MDRVEAQLDLEIETSIKFVNLILISPSDILGVVMFKVSTKGDYGLLLLSALAEAYQNNTAFVALKEIAKVKNLSLSYISQIIIPLKNAGLVQSKEGHLGGYRLTKPPREITMMEILEALEGPITPVRCCDNKAGKCGSEAYCNVKFTWQDARALLSQFLRTKTLEDIIHHPQKIYVPH